MSGRRMVKKSYDIDPSYAGVVIGRQGAGIMALKEIPNVHNVYLDTKSSTSSHKLIVSANSKEVCDSVFCEIQKRIKDKQRALKFKGSEKIYIHEENKSLQQILLKPITLNNDVVYRSIQSLFQVSRFEPSDLSDAMAGLGITRQDSRKEVFNELSKQDFFDSIEEDLKQNKNLNAPFKFTASPGKVAFCSVAGRPEQKLLRGNLTDHGTQYLNDLNIKTRFSPNLNINIMEKLNKNLSINGFKLLNDEPEKFTVVHLFAGNENTFFHVQLADNLDDNLESTSTDDMRLSPEKKEMLQKVLSAKTIGDVMKCSGKFETPNDTKVAYRRLTLQVHPDKNLHEGATDAFKVLQNAHNNLNEGKHPTTKALEIKRTTGNAPVCSPPKVISVQTGKKILSRITTCSSKRMDMRAKLSTISNVPNGLSKHVTQVLNTCWEKRGDNGDIPVPEGGVVKLQCIKQVKSSYHWFKEVALEERSEEKIDLNITVKSIREKTDDNNGWKDSLEVDLEDGCMNLMDRSQINGEYVFKRWNVMNNIIDCLFNN